MTIFFSKRTGRFKSIRRFSGDVLNMLITLPPCKFKFDELKIVKKEYYRRLEGKKKYFFFCRFIIFPVHLQPFTGRVGFKPGDFPDFRKIL